MRNLLLLIAGIAIGTAIAGIPLYGMLREDRAHASERIAQYQREAEECRADLTRLHAVIDAIPEPAHEPERPSTPAPSLILPDFGEWRPRVTRDEMTRENVWSLTTRSRDAFELESPYAGSQYAYLVLRDHPSNDGPDAMLRIERGQILCHTYDCDLEIAFDDSEPSRWRGAGSADSDSDVVFIRDTARFEREARRADEIRVRVTIYRNGSKIFVFRGLRGQPQLDQLEALQDAGPTDAGI